MWLVMPIMAHLAGRGTNGLLLQPTGDGAIQIFVARLINSVRL